MRKFVAAALFAAALGGMAVIASPGARAASAVGKTTAVIDVVGDMSHFVPVRGSNRYKEQIRRHLRAGQRGDGEALRNLGFHYAKGWGVIRDLTKAYMWFTLAGMRGNQDALENRDTIAATLSAEQIARAESMAENWLKSNEWKLEGGDFGA